MAMAATGSKTAGGRDRDNRRLEGGQGCVRLGRVGGEAPLYLACTMHFKSLFSRAPWVLQQLPEPLPPLEPGLKGADGLMQGFDSSDPR